MKKVLATGVSNRVLVLKATFYENGLLENGLVTPRIVKSVSSTTTIRRVYGPEDRIEVSSLPASSDEFKNANAVMCLMTTGNLWHDYPKKGTSTINASSLSYNIQINPDLGHPLCSGELFRDQPVAGIGTAFLISSTQAVTAGHCLFNIRTGDTQNLQRLRLVFGFRANATGTFPSPWTIPNSEIYQINRVVAYNYMHKNAREAYSQSDWAVVELDRPVPAHDAKKGTGHDPVKLGRGFPLEGQELYVIGHPSGIPVKFARNAFVRSSDLSKAFFQASLDTFAGNSGSPVFSCSTHQVEGILVRGYQDYEVVNNGSGGSCVRPFRDADNSESLPSVQRIAFYRALTNPLSVLQLKVETSWQLYSGTDSNIWFSMIIMNNGMRIHVEDRQSLTQNGSFERGSIDTINYPNFGETGFKRGSQLVHLSLRKDLSGGLNPDWRMYKLQLLFNGVIAFEFTEDKEFTGSFQTWGMTTQDPISQAGRSQLDHVSFPPQFAMVRSRL